MHALGKEYHTWQVTCGLSAAFFRKNWPPTDTGHTRTSRNKYYTFPKFCSFLAYLWTFTCHNLGLLSESSFRPAYSAVRGSQKKFTRFHNATPSINLYTVYRSEDERGVFWKTAYAGMLSKKRDGAWEWTSACMQYSLSLSLPKKSVRGVSIFVEIWHLRSKSGNPTDPQSGPLSFVFFF